MSESDFRPYPIKVIARRTITCARCGRETTRTRTFCRRIKAIDIEATVRADLEREAAAWKPTGHRRCDRMPARRPVVA